MFAPQAEGGHPRYVRELMTSLACQPDSGYRFEWVSTEDLEEQFKSDQYTVHTALPRLRRRHEFATPLHWAASRLLYYPRRELAFLEYLKTRPDIIAVHFQEWKPWLAATLFRQIKKLGKKVFYTVHNIQPHNYPKFLPRSVLNGWIRKGCLECDGLFVLTGQLKGRLSEFLGQPHPPIRVTPHGVWTVDDFAQDLTVEERLEKKRLLFFGSIRRNKGLDLLLRAAVDLPGFGITIAGPPDEKVYVQTEILPRIKSLREAGMNIDLFDRFVPDNEVGRIFTSHSAIVLPYTKSFMAQSGVAFMALAYELPMIASEAGGLRDLMNEFKVGVTFADYTPVGLANAVRSLYAGGRPADLAAQIRAARNHYSWDAAARETIAGYRTVLQGRREQDSDALCTTAAR